MRATAISLFSTAILMGGCGVAPVGNDTQAVTSLDVAPTGKGAGVFNKFAKPNGEGKVRPGGGGNGISYHGGPIVVGTLNVYTIWYGSWTGNTATTRSMAPPAARSAKCRDARSAQNLEGSRIAPS